MKTGILIACIATVVLAGCGGGKSSNPMASTAPAIPPVGGGTTQPPAAEPPQSLAEAANDSERIASVAAAIGTAAELEPGTSLGLVTARAEHGSGRPAVSLNHSTGWSIGSGDGNPMTKVGDFGP